MSRAYALTPVPGTASTDTTARTAANDALALIKKMQPDPGASIAPGGEAFASGQLYTNPTAGALNLPTTLTQPNMLGAGFALVDSGNGSQNKPIFRSNTTQDIRPTAAEFPSPTTKDTAYINLNGTGYEDWSYATGTWVKVGSMIPGANKAKPLYRLSSATGESPTSTEFPSPKEDDAAWINLNETGYEDWIYKAGAWSKVGGRSQAASAIGFDNASIALPNSPSNVQAALGELNIAISTLNDKSRAGIRVVRADTDRMLKSINSDGSERMTLAAEFDDFLLPGGTTGQAFRVVVPIGSGNFKVGGVSYALLSEPQILTWYWDVTLNGYRVVGIPQTATVGTTPTPTPTPTPTAAAIASESVAMAALPADTWTNIPAGTTVTSPADFSVFNSAGNLLRLPRRLSAGKWQVVSSIAATSLSVLLKA